MHKWVGLMLVSLLFACASPPPFLQDVTQGEETRTEDDVASAGYDKSSSGIDRSDKYAVIRAMEDNMTLFLQQSLKRFDELNTKFSKKVGSLKVPTQFQAMDPDLRHFFIDDENAFMAEVEKISEVSEREIKHNLDYLTKRAWDIAFEVTGTEDIGASYGSRTGIKEVDDMAEATINQMMYRSGLEEIPNERAYARSNRLLMNRIYSYETPGHGRTSLFASDPMSDYFRKNEDAVAVSVTYQNNDPNPDVKIVFRQAVRNRIVYNDSNLYVSKFKWDNTLLNEKGVLRFHDKKDHDQLYVSTIFFPRIDIENPNMEKLKDYVAVRDYKTVIIDSTTGKILDCFAWQYIWRISHFGAVSMEMGVFPVKEENYLEIEALLIKERE